MRNHPVSPVVFATILGACALEAELLNSERIGERFGSFGIEILEHDADVRRSNLYSIEDDQRVCRTYAVVRFLKHGSGELASLHSAVLGGESIGATFKAAGWELDKESLYFGEIALPASGHEIVSLMRLDAPRPLALHAYRLILSKESQSIRYATIIETYHPDYLTVRELTRLYPDDKPAPLDEQQLARLTQLVLEAS